MFGFGKSKRVVSLDEALLAKVQSTVAEVIGSALGGLLLAMEAGVQEALQRIQEASSEPTEGKPAKKAIAEKPSPKKPVNRLEAVSNGQAHE